MPYKGSRYDELERKRQETGPRDGREQRFKYFDQDGHELPKDERKIGELIRSGKLEEQKIFRVHDADEKEFLRREG